MRIEVIGGGPAGLYLALLMKKADASHEITVYERNPPDATFGWGVVFSDETLGALRDADRVTYDAIAETFARWGAIEIRYRGETIRSRGHAFTAIARVRLLQILQRRCAELGVALRFHEEADAEELRDADLVVAADGVHSATRARHETIVKPSIDVHRTRYIWFGTDLVFRAFTFIFRESEHGLFQVHAYPFDARTSTFIVECPEDTWRRAGLRGAREERSIRFCEELFGEDLGGHRLMSNRSQWINFETLRCESWHDGNVVFAGDAAHTAHFTIGSGTKLAMEDAIALAEALQRFPADVERALTEYELERQPVVERFQQAAGESARYFEGVRRYAGFEPLQFAFNLLTRSGRITHLELERRDPALVTAVDGWFARDAAERAGRRAARLAPPPVFAPLRQRGCVAENRVVLAVRSDDDATEGRPSARAVERLRSAARAGAAVVLSEPIAVSPEGRATPGSPRLDAPDHADAWAEAVRAVHETPGALAVARLSHAGPRASTRPRRDGVDRPLREGGWRVVAASPVLLSSRAARPVPLDADEIDDVLERFTIAAQLADRARFDALELDVAGGRLLHSFLSPVTNRRRDAYGGSLERRLRVPVETITAVREAWSSTKPLWIRVQATDWVAGGWTVDDAVALVAPARDAGADLVHVVAEPWSPRARPEYGRLWLVPFADRIRNELGIATLVGGITTRDEANTVLAAGRADLCLLG